ncbi:hypothetical protein ACFLR1_06115 [Bacteroidota bacterium]
MELIKKYANHRLVVFLYLFLITVLFFKVYDRVFDKKVHLGGDNAGYYIYGKAIAQGAGYVSIHTKDQKKGNHFPPGYSALIAVVMKTFSGKVNTIKAANGFYLLAALFALFFLFRALTKNIHLSFVAVLITLYNYHILQYSTIMMSEISYLLFSSLSLLLFAFVDFKKSPFKNATFIFFILTLTFSFYIRTMGISLFLSFLLILLIQKHWKYAGVLTVGFLLLIAPWQIRSHSLGGNSYVNQLLQKNPYRPELGKMEIADWPIRVKKNILRYSAVEIYNGILPFEVVDYKAVNKQLNRKDTAAVASNATPPVAEKKEDSNKKSIAANNKFGKKNSTKEVRKPLFKTEVTMTDYILFAILLLLTIIGVTRLKQHRLLIGLYLLGTFSILCLWPEAWFGVRFMLPLIPLLIFLALNGITELSSLTFMVLKKKEPWILTLIIPFLVFYPVYGKLEKRVDELEMQAKGVYINKFKNYFDIATWANKNLEKDAVVSCRKGQLFHLYANRYITGFKSTLDAEDLIKDLHEKGVTHVVLDQLGYSSTGRYLYPAIKKYPGKFQVIKQLKNPDTYLMKFDYNLDYTGTWKNGKKSGKGTMGLPDGTQLRGIWKNDMLSGKVGLFSKEGKLTNTAYYQNNQKISN